MGIMARPDFGLCALLLLQLLCASHCYEGVRCHGGRKLEVPKRGLSTADNSTVVRAQLIHRDSLQTGTNTTTKSRSERFLDAVKRSHSRANQLLQKNVRRLTGEESMSVSLTSPENEADGVAKYVMQISLGTPAQNFIGIADTSGDLIWVQSYPCSRGSSFQQPDPLFNPKASTTYSQARCTDALCKALGPSDSTCSSRHTCSYIYGYGDSENDAQTQGDLAYETVTLGSAVRHIGFGCGYDQEGYFAGADGLIGLGQGPLSLPSQLSKASITQIFSYCLVDQSSESGTTSSPIIFGGAARNSAAKYTPLVSNAESPAFYYVGVTGISVGSTKVKIPVSASQINPNSGLGGVILDSGTSLTMWRTKAFHPILAITHPQLDGSPCGLELWYDISGVSAASVTFPAMVVHMLNVELKTPGSTLFVQVDDSGQTVCQAMGPGNQFSIIGNIHQKNNIIVYDVVNQRVGFEATDCARLS